MLEKAYSPTRTRRSTTGSARSFEAMDKGDPVLNVPTYNGGLFNTAPDATDDRDQRIARFLRDHQVPDRYLARAIDRLARDQDEKTLGLVFIDYKSLEVRHLGSIYEGLLEFKLKVADEDLTTQTDKNQEKYIPLSEAKVKRGRSRSRWSSRKARSTSPTTRPSGRRRVPTTRPTRSSSTSSARRSARCWTRSWKPCGREFRKVRQDLRERVAESRRRTRPRACLRRRTRRRSGSCAVEKTYDTHKDLVEQSLRPARCSTRRWAVVTSWSKPSTSSPTSCSSSSTVPDQPGQLRPGADPHVASWNPSASRASRSIRDKLTDINLLKRHVLKRCIYGVDLNPMAVELAKVSLWLDAFTLGAPLNFLDHHLRCGNSLIGATFKDLEEATDGTLFRLDYGPLLRAINYVLFVSKMADATAAEVATFRQSIRPGQEVAVGLPDRPRSRCSPSISACPRPGTRVSSGSDLDLSDRETVPGLAARTTREGSWSPRSRRWRNDPIVASSTGRSSFPRSSSASSIANQRQIKHKDRIKEGTAGFDCIVGNPPYVRQETIKPVKSF